MINNKLFQDLLEKEMDRKQFLKVLAAGVVGLIGITAFMNNLEKVSRIEVKPSETNPQISSKGYGGSAYGK